MFEKMFKRSEKVQKGTAEGVMNPAQNPEMHKMLDNHGMPHFGETDAEALAKANEANKGYL